MDSEAVFLAMMRASLDVDPVGGTEEVIGRLLRSRKRAAGTANGFGSHKALRTAKICSRSALRKTTQRIRSTIRKRQEKWSSYLSRSTIPRIGRKCRAITS
jgi:hypothetical protein